MGVSHDKISELPDPILAHILSFMPAKPAIMTSILSRRWRGLWEHTWASATTLDFTAEFAARQTPDEFVATANRYLELHCAKKIQSFLMSFDPDRRHFPDIEKWIAFAVAKGVEELRLDLFSGPSYYVSDLRSWVRDFRVPHQLSDCMSLRMLSLSNCRLCPAPDFGRLRSLESLSLVRVDVTDDVLQSILSRCHHLERLLLRDCAHFNSLMLTSPAIRLKQLVLVDCWELYHMEISAPSLRSFHFYGLLNFSHFFTEISGLADVFICCLDSSEPDHNYIELLSELAHVEILTLCTAILARVTIWSEYMPENVPALLPNLRELQLLMDHMNPENLSFIYGFFRLCPSPVLERLFVRLPEIPENSVERGAAIEQPPDVCFNQLRMIKMYNFKGSTSEMKLVRFLLEKAPFLQSLVLVAPPRSRPREEGINAGPDGSSPRLKFIEEMDMRILQGQVSVLPRASSAVKPVVCEYLEDDLNITPTHTELYSDAAYVSH